MKRILLFLLIGGCSSALPEKNPQDIAYTSLHSVDTVLPELRQSVLQCRQHLAESRRMMQELEALQKQVKVLQGRCRNAEKVSQSYISRLNAQEEQQQAEVLEKTTEYSPSDAPLD